MYAHALRKWSPIKLLMYLWLPVLMLLVYWCQGASSMHLTPVNAMQQQNQQQQQHQQHQINANYFQTKYNPYQLNNDKIDENYKKYSKIMDGNPSYIRHSNRFKILPQKLVESRNKHERTERVINEPNNRFLNNKKFFDDNNNQNLQKSSIDNNEKVTQIDYQILNHDSRSDININENGNNSPIESPDAQQKQWILRMEERRVRTQAHRRKLINAMSDEQYQQQQQKQQQQQRKQQEENQQQQISDTPNKNLKIISGRNRRESRHHNHLNTRTKRRRYCSARDPATLSYQAPTVFEGKIRSMSSDRRKNFYVTFEVQEIYKKQKGYNLPQLVRLQFMYKNTSECDIYRETFKSIGYVRDELEQGSVYFLFVTQINLGNFTILGQPIKRTRKIISDVKLGVSENYGKRASIISLNNDTVVQHGKRLRLICKVDGQPPPKVTWFKNKESLNKNRSKSNYKFEHLRRKSFLTIEKVGEKDSGVYECRAKNKVERRPVIRTVNIRVERPNMEGEPCPTDNEYCLNGSECLYFKDIGEQACKCSEGFMGNRCESKNINPESKTYNLDSTLPTRFDDDDDDI